MDFLFVVGIAQAFFFAFLASRKKEPSVADKILIAWLVFIGLHLLGFYLDYSGFSRRYPHIMGFDRFMPLAEGPFLWIYCQALLKGSKTFDLRWLIHFAPFLLLNLAITSFYLLPADEKLYYLDNILWTSPPLAAIVGSHLNLYSGPAYVIAVLVRLRFFRRGLKNFFSNTEKVNLLWLQRLAWGLGAIWAVVIASNIYCKVYDCDLAHHNDYYIYIAVALFVLYLGYYGLRYENILVRFGKAGEAGPSEKNQPEDKYRRSGLKADEEKKLFDSIVQLLEQQKLYREQNLTLDDLAKELSAPRHYLSQAIGHQSGQTFYSLVNGFRVAEAREKLQSGDYAHFSLLGVGLDCGFNSKASFNRVFKEFTGMTPSQFKEQYEKNAAG